MRKKSHVSLAGYLVRELGSENLTKHKRAFYFGSVRPDLNPRMFKEPHKFDVTYGQFKEKVSRIVMDGRDGKCSKTSLWCRTGEVLHYLADYFTYPHNTVYDGGVKGHCLHERDLKYLLRKYVRTPEAQKVFDGQRAVAGEIKDLPELFRYIETCHKEYLRQPSSVEGDCRWIVRMCGMAVIAITEMACQGQEVMETEPFWRCA